ncbi:MAG: inorganic phosphate transporter [Flavobacteriaceae bacterium]|nr:inorganic phosphate transporter [Flavobacteriaceae bacterium]
MEIYFMILVGIAFLLAVTDLFVGVSNDAVNFLNSAIGSKAYPLRVIMIVASAGVLMGAVSSSGMMEVARKGIFMPGMFHFDEIMMLFMGVMLTDVLLLNLFNSLGLPTSTTVSIVFELLGASVAVALIQVNASDTDALRIENLGEYINTGKAMLIIAGILLSVVVAFSVGALVQYISRVIFTFQYEKKIPYFGSLFGGFSIATIVYFIFVKGLKGTAYYKDFRHILDENLLWILLGTFVFFTVMCQVLNKLFKFNPLKFIVLIGTFSLAMAFAGNDLVNFIGVPIASFQSFNLWTESGINPADFQMDGLSGKVATPTIFLFGAGLIMVLTLWFSKKSKAVIETGVNLSRQGDGAERFDSNAVSRALVRVSLGFSNTLSRVLPQAVLDKVESRFYQPEEELTKKERAEKPAFDLVRASVNLVVAAILISIGTSLKLPLSTTYVTFMVAMGTSLADRAWNRESAVYRIAGVMNVIGGWFLTAFVAFSSAALMAYIIHLGQLLGGAIGGHFGNESYGRILGLFCFAVLLATVVLGSLVYSIFFKKEVQEEEETVQVALDELTIVAEDKEEFISKATRSVSSILKNIAQIYVKGTKALIEQDLKSLKKVSEKAEKVSDKSKRLRDNVHYVIHDLQTVSLEAGNHYVQIADYLREIGHAISFVVNPMKTYLDNNHSPLTPKQENELTELSGLIKELYEDVNRVANTQLDVADGTAEFEMIQERQQEILKFIQQIRKKQIKRIKKNAVGTRNSVLYLTVLNETRALTLYTGNVVKSLRDFSLSSQEALSE